MGAQKTGPLLGHITTREMLQEIVARLEVARVIGEGSAYDAGVEEACIGALDNMRKLVLDYRTADS